jgi:threonine/homoserine/homoserine lactone efflux protein
MINADPDMAFAPLLPLAWFLFVATITPGPNNTMLTASGMNFGLRRSLGHMAGIVCGFGSLIFLCAIGLGALYERLPEFRLFLQIAGATYLVYLAWRIACTGSVQASHMARPLSFWQAAAFQYVNPKAWVVHLTAASSFLPEWGAPLSQALVMLLVAMVVAAPCTATWTLFGAGLARLWSGQRIRRIINVTLAVLLVATVPFVVF